MNRGKGGSRTFPNLFFRAEKVVKRERGRSSLEHLNRGIFVHSIMEQRRLKMLIINVLVIVMGFAGVFAGGGHPSRIILFLTFNSNIYYS